MTNQISIQLATDIPAPNPALLQQWCQKTLDDLKTQGEITIRIIDALEMAQFNQQYRHKQGATNVLSFPATLPPDIDYPLLGDILICADVVNQEAQEQQKSQHAHWAHMVVHGTLHLLGFDHQLEDDAQVMETHEVEILRQLGYTNPYEIEAIQ